MRALKTCSGALIFFNTCTVLNPSTGSGSFLQLKLTCRHLLLLYSLIADKNSVMQLREEHGVAYHRSFPGCQLIDWLLQNGEVESRRQGIDLCRALQEHGIVQHGEGCPPVLLGPNGRDPSTQQPANSIVRSHSRYQWQRSTTSSTAGCSTSSASTSVGAVGCLSC